MHQEGGSTIAGRDLQRLLDMEQKVHVRPGCGQRLCGDLRDATDMQSVSVQRLIGKGLPSPRCCRYTVVEWRRTGSRCGSI